MSNIIRCGIINDLHIPYHDPRSVSLVLDIFEDIGIDEIIINGDLLDFYGISTYGKSPSVQKALEDEIFAGQEFFINLRKKFKEQKIVYIAGNHSYRLDRYIADKCPAFWNLVRLENMLDLKSLNIEYYEYNSAYRIYETNLFIQHSPPSYSKNAAMTSLDRKFDASYIFGCTHRRDYACRTGATGNLYEVYMNGWLGSTNLSRDHFEVFRYAKGHQNWQQCFSVATIIDKKDHFISQYGINNHKAVVDGYVYQG